MRLWSIIPLALLCAGTSSAAPVPALVRSGEATQLVVDGAPYLILGGELANSSASSRGYLASRWPQLRAMGLNTLIAPVSWELIEPEEGRFDFSTADALIEDARANGLRLVLLWFGSWKNSMSSYVPGWVKRDAARFPRVHGPDGKAMEMLSAFDPHARDADARAFAALMRHLKAVDGDRRTVIMVQVENEVAMIPSAREHGRAADAAFAGPVPRAMTEWLASHRQSLAPQLKALWEANGARRSGSWAELFGSGDAGEEIFSAWHFARYVETVSAAGKAAYDLPFYVNAALARPGKKPGEYPSGGPLPHLFDIWKAGAPSIDLLAPDIYFPNFSEWSAAYAAFNPLIIPEAEQAGDPRSAANFWLTIGRHRGIGFSAFSIDSIAGTPAGDRLASTYKLAGSMLPIILEGQRKGRIGGFAPPLSFDGKVDEREQQAVIGDYRFTITFIDPWTPRDRQKIDQHGGIIVQAGPEDYWVAGEGIVVTVAPADPARGAAGIDSAWEGRFIDGVWRPGRLLNGDETHQGRHIRLPPGAPSVQRVRFYRYR
jgi:beta-galactosidase GanA